MAVAIGVTVANIITGIGSAAASVGFSLAEKKKLDQLNAEIQELKNYSARVYDLYNNTYYMVAVNLDRVAKAIEDIPNGYIETVEVKITRIRPGAQVTKAFKTFADVMNYATKGLKFISRGGRDIQDNLGFIDPESPWKNLPKAERKRTFKSVIATKKAHRILTGVEVAGAVFGIFSLAATIGLGVWTLEKLDEAIQDVRMKKAELTNFEKGMKGT